MFLRHQEAETCTWAVGAEAESLPSSKRLHLSPPPQPPCGLVINSFCVFCLFVFS